MDLSSLFSQISALLGGWPMLLYVVGISIICTLVLKGLQFTYLGYAWRAALYPEKTKKLGDMTPFDALINTLNANLGNGSVAGMATAVYSGGPGAAFWVLVFGFFVMSIRFSEVFLSTHYGAQADTSKTFLGGPMLYLKNVFGGNVLAKLFGFLCLCFGLSVGNAMQANSIRLILQDTWRVPPMYTAVALLLFIIYVVTGGAPRVVKLSNKIVPLKVVVFFTAAFITLGYNYQAILPALMLIFKSAFQPVAAVGGVLGFTVQQAMRFGINRSVMATESGLGTAAVLFGYTGSKSAVNDGIMAMLSTFISTIVCFLIALCIVASGVWDSGLTSTPLTSAAFSTAFGQYGGWVVSFLSISFGIGVMVTFTYIARQCWLSVTGGKFQLLYPAVYCACTFAGALADVHAVFDIGDIIIWLMLAINLYAIMYLLPVIQQAVSVFSAKQK